MSRTNRRITLAKRPDGPVSEDDFSEDTVPVPDLADGEILVETTWLSIDATIRTWIAYDTYLPAVRIGDPVRSFGLGTVVESSSGDIPVGAMVQGQFNWQQYAVVRSRDVQLVPPDTDPEAVLNVFGIAGLTAYFGLLDVGRPEAGETVFISGAAGSVGSLAGQIAKLRGCRVVGIAGSDEKCAWLEDELGFDAVINYKTERVSSAIARTCPDGVDIYFDNVGGPILEAALANMARHGRIVLCGAISQYDIDVADMPPGPRNYAVIISKRLRMEGFIILDYWSRIPEAIAELAPWVLSGQLVSRSHVVEGLDNAPSALRQLLNGQNTGKMLVRI